MLKAIRSFIDKRRHPVDRITGLQLDGDSIVLEGVDSPRNRIPLGRISRIVAYKRDMLTSDLVCFVVTYESEDRSIWHVTLHEDMRGFAEIERRLAQLPGYDAKWRERVIQPPFRVNETVIFDSGTTRAGTTTV